MRFQTLTRVAVAGLIGLLLSGCGEKQDQGWLGYGEGDSALIAAPQAGWITDLKVERGGSVHRGDLLFTLDSTQQQASREEAQATLGQSRAALRQEIRELL